MICSSLYLLFFMSVAKHGIELINSPGSKRTLNLNDPHNPLIQEEVWR